MNCAAAVTPAAIRPATDSEPAVPRMAAALPLPQPSVSRIVAAVIAVAPTTAIGSGGTPCRMSGRMILRITAIVRPSATSARTPCQPPTTVTPTANRMIRAAIGSKRQRSATAMYGSGSLASCVIVTTTWSPGAYAATSCDPPGPSTNAVTVWPLSAPSRSRTCAVNTGAPPASEPPTSGGMISRISPLYASTGAPMSGDGGARSGMSVMRTMRMTPPRMTVSWRRTSLEVGIARQRTRPKALR